MSRKNGDDIDEKDIEKARSRFTDPVVMSNIHRYSICSSCSNRTRQNDKNEKKTCKAFPGGIPSKFINGLVDHTSFYPGDNGVTFQP